MSSSSGRRWAFGLVVVALSILAAACAGAGDGETPTSEASTSIEGSTSSAPDTSDRPLRLGMAVHSAIEGASFWGVVALGALEAAEASSVDVEIRGDLDPRVQVRIIETFIADGVDGLIVSLADPMALKPALDQAAAAGIPLITVNSGIDFYLETSALTHVGQSELTAGREIGNRFNAMELSGSIMCFVQEFNNVGLEERCDGLIETYVGGEVVRFREEIGVTQPAEAISLISGALEEGGEYAAVVTLDPVTGLFAVDAARAAQVEVVVTTFDTPPVVLEAIREGDFAFTVDQQPYLQGYRSVELLIEHLRDGRTPEPGNPTETGPFFVDDTNVDLVEEEAKAIAERLEARFFSS